MSVERSPSLPWYRHFHVWLLIAFPALSVAMGVTTVWLAVKTDDGLVADDYYRQGLEINARMERDRRAEELGLGVELRLDAAASEVIVLLRAGPDFSPPEQLQLSFLHPTRAGLDRLLQPERTGPFRYAAPLPPLAPGRWHVQIAADDWRLVERVSVD